MLKGQYSMPWLPDKESNWYSREVWCLEKGKKADRALPHLHDSLQRFAITFHHLRAFRLKSNINVDLTMNRRNEIIMQTQNEIYRVRNIFTSYYALISHHGDYYYSNYEMGQVVPPIFNKSWKLLPIILN